MTKSLKLLILLSIVFGLTQQGFSQFTNLSIDEAYEKYRDSLRTTPYPWTLPIMGAKVRELGFDIPYPSGVYFKYYY